MRYFTLLTVLVLFQVLYSCGQSQKQNTKNNASPGKDSSIAVFSGTQPSINMNDGKDTGKAFQLFQQGVNEMKEQRYEDAVSTFLSALELDPQNPKSFLQFWDPVIIHSRNIHSHFHISVMRSSLIHLTHHQ